MDELSTPSPLSQGLLRQWAGLDIKGAFYWCGGGEGGMFEAKSIQKIIMEKMQHILMGIP